MSNGEIFLIGTTSYILSVAFVVSTILLIWKWKTRNVKPFFYAFLSWGAFSVQYLLHGTAFFSKDYFISNFLYDTSQVFTVIAVLLFVVFIDTVTRESVSVIKIGIVSAIGGVLIYTNYFSDYILPTMPFASFYALILDVYLIIIFIFLVRSTLKAPPHLKKFSLFLTVMTVALGSLSVIFSTIYLTEGYFFSGIYAAIMNLILVIVLVRHPELLYILPYRVHRLTVIHRKIGVSIFDHQFALSDIDQDLLAGLLSALEQTSIEVLHRGELEEVTLSEGILIFVKANYISVGLITSNSSKHLRDSLRKFANEFENQFKDLLVRDVFDLNEFKPANQILDFYFGNIPSYQ